MLVVAAIGAVTLVLAACSALVQHDIKRVLAYSTMSQIGYMFLGLGVGAWGAAIFHFMTHAFFKSLLFLGAGVLIQAQHEDHNLHHMGGLRRRLPGTFWTFLIGAASLAAVPLVTAGFYSKDLIISQAWLSPQGGPWLWAAAWVGVWLTSVYTFRMVFLAFWGPEREGELHQPTAIMVGPMVVLAALSLVAGFVQAPPGRPYFAQFLGPALPLSPTSEALGGTQIGLQLLSAVATLLGIWIAWALYGRRRRGAETALGALGRFWLEGWGFDRLYEACLVRPYVWLARVDREDAVDWIYRGLAGLALALHRGLSATQTGRVRWYAAGVAAGALVLIALVMRL
jgi:NADH-quinone oxidoreductase subunit L